MPQSTLLPLITAVNKRAEGKDEKFDWASVDFVTDRNGLRKLMRWAGAGNGSDVRDFRIDLQLAGEKTVLFNRWEKRTRELANGRTFGFSFEKASTQVANGCKDSTGHHRIISYVGRLQLFSFTLRLKLNYQTYLGPQWTKDGGPI